MKKIAKQAMVLGCFFVVAVVVSSAQTVGLRVDIPFNFNVAEKVLPAGHYLILAPQGQTLKILGPNGAAAIAMTNPVSGRRTEGPGAVAFNCYGRRCFLSQFWTARTQTGQEVLKCRIEKELATEKEQLAVITLKATPYQQ
jgi:ABC-type hemin transport system ATPase subunit